MLDTPSFSSPTPAASDYVATSPEAPSAEPVSFDPDVFAIAWYAAWNSHDLDSILAHYTEDVVFESPFAQQFANESGVVRGKAELRAYFSRALTANPTLAFEPLIVFAGVSSIVLMYRSIQNLLAAETMEFDSTGRVRRVLAHYTPEK